VLYDQNNSEINPPSPPSQTDPDGQLREYRNFLTQEGLYDCSWSEMNQNQLVSASADGSLKLWDVMTTDDYPIAHWYVPLFSVLPSLPHPSLTYSEGCVLSISSPPSLPPFLPSSPGTNTKPRPPPWTGTSSTKQPSSPPPGTAASSSGTPTTLPPSLPTSVIKGVCITQSGLRATRLVSSPALRMAVSVSGIPPSLPPFLRL